MNISVILAHPAPKSFNHAIARTVVEKLTRGGYDVFFHDLHFEKFNPILPAWEIPTDGSVPGNIQGYCDELVQSDGIVIVHPNWWGQPPAILKGWIDRVVRPGVAYEFEENDSGEGIPIGLLKAKVAIVFNTANTPTKREQEAFGDPLQLLWKNCIFDLCGVPEFRRRTFTVVVTSTAEEREAWLQDVAQVIEENFRSD